MNGNKVEYKALTYDEYGLVRVLINGIPLGKYDGLEKAEAAAKQWCREHPLDGAVQA